VSPKIEEGRMVLTSAAKMYLCDQ